MSGYSVAPVPATPAPKGTTIVTPNGRGGMRVTVTVDREDWTPDAIDRLLRSAKATMLEYAAARRGDPARSE